MKKILLGAGAILVAIGIAAPASAAVTGRRRPRWSLRSMTGAASTSAPTAAGDRATSAGILLTMVSDQFRPLGKVVMMQLAVSPADKSVTAGRPALGCGVLKAKATGPIFAARMSASLTRFSKTARGLT